MKKEITEETRVENKKVMLVYMTCVTTIAFCYFFGYIGSIIDTYPNLSILDSVIRIMNDFHIFYPLNTKAILGILLGFVCGGLYYFFADLHDQKTHTYKKNEVSGSARFMTKKEMAEFTKEYIEPNPTDLSKPFPSMIMSQNFGRPVNSRKLIGNNNVLVVGAAGTGKSRFLIKPNVLQMNSSYVITDPSGEMIYSLGHALKEFGYKIKIFNISDMTHSNCYNPLEYIRNEAGVNMLIDCFIKNTTKDGAKGDEFFTNAERLLYSACIYYLWQNCSDQSRKNFGSVINMVNSSAVDENNANAKSPLDDLFDQLPKNCLAWKYYKAFKQAAGKTLKSIIISCVTRLQPFLTPQVANLTKSDDLELDKMGDELTALFIITPQADRTYAFLASMLYSQLFEVLYFKAEQQKAKTGSEQLKIPVRCLMDEFANIGEVPDFPSKLSTMRKYNISATVILQDISQIEAMYKEEWKTLVGNCSSIILLGSQEPNTLKYFSDMLGKSTVIDGGRGVTHGKSGSSNMNYKNQARELRFADELARMDPKECIVFTQNQRPVLDKKFQYEKHARYKQTADADNSKGFIYKDMAIYDNTKLSTINNLIKAKTEAARIRKQNEITDPKNANTGYLKGSKDEAVGNLEPSKENVIASNLYITNDIKEQFLKNEESPIAFAFLNSVPTKKLVNIIKSIEKSMDKPFIVFTDLDEKNMIHALSYNKNTEFYDVVMNNEYQKSFKIQKGTCIIELSKHRIEDYKDEVLKLLPTINSLPSDEVKKNKKASSSSSENLDFSDVDSVHTDSEHETPIMDVEEMEITINESDL